LIITRNGKEFNYAVFTHVLIELKTDIPYCSTLFQDALNQITTYAERIFFCSRLLGREKLLGILAEPDGYYIIRFSFIKDKVIPLVFPQFVYSELEPLCGILSDEELSKVFVIPDSFLYNGKRTIGHLQDVERLDGSNESLASSALTIGEDQSESEPIEKRSKCQPESSSVYSSSDSD
jgi:hypothetical protein